MKGQDEVHGNRKNNFFSNSHLQKASSSATTDIITIPIGDKHLNSGSTTSAQQQQQSALSNMNELRFVCVRAFRAAISAVQPYERVRTALKVTGSQLSVGQRIYQLNHNVHLAAVGKAALGMVQGAEASIGGHVVEGIASVPRNTIAKIPSGARIVTQFFEGATNNLPDEDACINAERIEAMARHLRDPNDLFIVLISGGGSALLPAPTNSISLSDKLTTIKAMTSRGAEIKQLNCVRQALSRLKGGKLAEIAHPAKVVSVIISDIVGDPVDLIASGPTVIDQTSMSNESPIHVLKTLDAWDAIPENVQHALQQEAMVKPKKPDVDVNNTIISNNQTAIQGVQSSLRESRFLCHTASTTIAEDATHFGEQLADLIHQILVDGVKPESALESLNQANINIKCPDEDRIAILFGGETTVKVTGEGQGGRNQQIVLSALSKLLEKNTAQHLQGQFALLSSGTDGQDGPTEAAGAVLTNEDLALIAKEGSELKLNDVNEFLRNNDSYNFWKKFQDGVCHVQTGPTGTNVMDVQILLINKQKSEK